MAAKPLVSWPWSSAAAEQQQYVWTMTMSCYSNKLHLAPHTKSTFNEVMQLQTVDLGFEHPGEKVFLKPPAADYRTLCPTHCSNDNWLGRWFQKYIHNNYIREMFDYRTAVDDIHITHESLVRLCTDEYSTHVYKWEIGHEVKQVRGSQKHMTTLRERCEQKAEHCFEKLKDHQSASTFLSLLCALSIGLPACEAAGFSPPIQQ